MIDVRQTAQLSEVYFKKYPDNSSLTKVFDLLENSPDPFNRNIYSPGHITASGIVFSPDQQHLILVFHKKLQLWLQPGGHVEPEDRDLISAAKREVREETGLVLSSEFLPELLSIDIHNIPASKNEPKHRHYDFKFAFKAEQKTFADSAENLEIKWLPIVQLVNERKPESVIRAAQRFRENLK